MPDLIDVRCRGCMRHLGVTPIPKYTVYCDALCASDRPAGAEEERDSLICAWYGHPDLNYSVAAIAKVYDITRQRVFQIVDKQ